MESVGFVKTSQLVFGLDFDRALMRLSSAKSRCCKTAVGVGVLITVVEGDVPSLRPGPRSSAQCKITADNQKRKWMHPNDPVFILRDDYSTVADR